MYYAVACGHVPLTIYLVNRLKPSSEEIQHLMKLAVTLARGDDVVVKLVQFLLSQGASVNQQYPWGVTALFYACERGYLAVVRVLVEQRASVATCDTFQRTPVWIAARTGHVSVLEFLLGKSAPFDIPDTEGWTPLMIALKNKHNDCVSMLLRCGSSIEARTCQGQTFLDFVAQGSGYERMEILLQEPTFRRQLQGKEKETLLFSACESNNKEVVEWLIDNGVSVCARTATRETPLFFACKHYGAEPAQFLVGHGADVNARDRLQRSPLFVASAYGREDVARFLVQQGVTVDAAISLLGWTPLHEAIDNAHLAFPPVKLIRCLIENGADVNTTTFDGRNPLYFALEKRLPEVIEYLIENDAVLPSKEDEALLRILYPNDYVQYLILLINRMCSSEKLPKDLSKLISMFVVQRGTAHTHLWRFCESDQ